MGWIFCLIVIIIIICGWIQPYRTATHNYFFLRNRLSVRQLENNNNNKNKKNNNNSITVQNISNDKYLVGLLSMRFVFLCDDHEKKTR